MRDLKDLMQQSIDLYGDKNAFEIKNQNNEHYFISFKQYGEDINSLGTALLDLGLLGEKIGVCGDSCYEWCLSYMAVVNGVGVIVPTDKELLFDDINAIIDTSDAKMMICDERIEKKLLEHLDKVREDVIFAVFKKKEDEGRFLSYDKLLEKGRALLKSGDKRYTDVVIDPEKMCTLLFTSGTTGMSKGVMLCQRNFCFEVENTMAVVKISPSDCGISMLPLHHTYENTIILFMALYSGATVTFCEGYKYVIKNMKEFSPTIFVSVPLLLEKVHTKILKAIREKGTSERKFAVGKMMCRLAKPFGIDMKKRIFGEIQQTFGGHMRLIICGGAPIDPKILEDFDAFGIQIIFGYGLTECAPLVIINNDKMHLSESIGVPLPNVEAKINFPDPETGIGEICVRGGMLMLGYYNNPEATAEVIDSDGWFHTGDLGRVDKKGRYYICGRSKNVIVTKNGKNIFPEELEYHMERALPVEECLVVGVENAKNDTIIKAIVYPNLDEIKELLGKSELTKSDVRGAISEIVAQVNKMLPPFKRISKFALRENEFVKTTTQKIKRFDRANLITEED